MRTTVLPEIDLTDKMVHLSRLYYASCETVFAAWSSADALKRWYAPYGCSVEIKHFDFRTGGTFLLCIRNPDYPDCWCTGTYHEIDAPKRIAFSMALCDEEGRLLDSDDAGKDADWPAETIVIVEFAEEDGQTTLSLHQNALESVAVRTGAQAGWLQMLERLAEVIR